MSEDHKVDNPGEKERILLRGGVIESYRDQKGLPIGPARVWLPNKSAPGLAMSRSIGDKIAHSLGVIAEPTIKQYFL